MQRARVLAENIGSPERATRVYEQVLEMQPGHAGALEALARLRELTGDAHAALSAIEALAAKAATAEAKAEQWVRAARLLEGRGDRDGAIERYKLALEANPKDTAAASALRQAYSARGDAASVVGLIERELEHAEGKTAKARLHARARAGAARQAARTTTRPRRTRRRRSTSTRRTPTRSSSSATSPSRASATSRRRKHLEPLVGPRRGAAQGGRGPRHRALRRGLRAERRRGRRRRRPRDGRESGPRRPSRATTRASRRPSRRSQQIAPDDADALARVARVMFDVRRHAVGPRDVRAPARAARGGAVPRRPRRRPVAPRRVATGASGELDKAVDFLREAADADPANPEPLHALARVYEQTGDWEEFIRTKRRRLEVATGAERFDLLLEIGDVEFSKLNDRARAQQDVRRGARGAPRRSQAPDEADAALLGGEGLGEARRGRAPPRRLRRGPEAAREVHAHGGDRELAPARRDRPGARRSTTRAIEFDPTLTKAMDEAIELRRQKGDHDGRRAPAQGAARAGEAGAGPGEDRRRCSTSWASSIASS